jgi:phosphatidylglycerophosphate synthase
MLDAPLRKVAAPVLAPVAAHLAHTRVSANVLTAASFAAGLGACAAVATHNFWWGLGLIAINRLLAGLDGPLARLTNANDLGAFLEPVFTVIVAAGIGFAFALADPSRALAAAFLIFALFAAGASYLGYAATAATRDAAAGNSRLLRYPGGLIENTETFLALALACALPGWFSVIAYVLGALCFATAGARIAEAVVSFR